MTNTTVLSSTKIRIQLFNTINILVTNTTVLSSTKISMQLFNVRHLVVISIHYLTLSSRAPAATSPTKPSAFAVAVVDSFSTTLLDGGGDEPRLCSLIREVVAEVG